MRLRKFANILFWMLAFLPLVAVIAAIPLLPDRIPSHFNFAGVIDRWGSKYEAFIVPCLTLLIMMSYRLVLRYCEKYERAYSICLWCFCASGLAFLSITAFQLYMGFTRTDVMSSQSPQALAIPSGSEFMTATYLLVPVITTIIGLVLNRKWPSDINPVIGYRSKRSMSSQAAWDFANKYSGKVMFLTGVTELFLTAMAITYIIGLTGLNLESSQVAVGIFLPQIVLLFFPIALTEYRLKKRFDKDGRAIS